MASNSTDTASFGFEDVPRAEKAGRVRAVFDSVAQRYDLMNDLMSAGLHRVWKDILADRINPQPGETLIDVAGGTGDIARRLSKRVEAARGRRGGPPAETFIVDINQEMLAAGRSRGEDNLDWICGDAENLPFPDKFADAYTIAFGIRNVTNIPAALKEARRVLKPGGRFACLEFSRFAVAALAPVYDAFSFHVIPQIGKIAANDSDSYRYLVESIRRFPDQETFAAMVSEAGFKRVSYQNLSAGVAAIHTGWAI
jgi:demethylmenaquinone methyltransferase/2-methoxy-6-polyprenyl-1,4-benzoquinol methylase